jgi:uncharacterized protein (DUF1810 family)
MVDILEDVIGICIERIFGRFSLLDTHSICPPMYLVRFATDEARIIVLVFL